ncbi:MAG TPA: Stp1/IreP family PP2C-type Ser/Thr phosphatase [Acidobacteriota bacterium]|nr:Stp1/IreP family PP2C-type Ser/Thr phosphatase [Acidobacteriota bacterium]
MAREVLHHGGIAFESAERSDTGLVRKNNEDSLVISPQHGLFGVCDGMGGHAAGEVASSLASEALNEAASNHSKKPLDLLRQAVERANRSIFETQARNPQYRGMGTTITALLLDTPQSWIVHVGDSRIYRWSSSEGLQQLSVDHSPVYRLYQQGMLDKDQLRRHPHKNLLDRSLGVMPTVEPDVFPIELQSGDVFLLCSDGLTDELSDREIAEILEGDDLQECAERLLAQAKATGGRDNISLILLRIVEMENPAS